MWLGHPIPSTMKLSHFCFYHVRMQEQNKVLGSEHSLHQLHPCCCLSCGNFPASRTPKVKYLQFINYLAFGIFLKSNTNELRQIPTINLHSGCEPRDPSCFYGWLCFAHLPVLGARWNNSPPLDSTTVQQRGNSKNLVRGQDCCKSQGDDSDDMEVSAGRSTSTTDMSVSLIVQLNQ